jgi:hypothetical protein
MGMDCSRGHTIGNFNIQLGESYNGLVMKKKIFFEKSIIKIIKIK